MSKDLRFYKKWLDANGKIVDINGKKYKIKVSAYGAVYPYERMVISVYADMIDKNDPEYIEIKKVLGDDWSTDVLESNDATYMSIYEQCFGKGE